MTLKTKTMAQKSGHSLQMKKSVHRFLILSLVTGVMPAANEIQDTSVVGNELANTTEKVKMCRTNLKFFLPLGTWYDRETCASCYSYMPNYMFKTPGHRLTHRRGYLWTVQHVNGSMILGEKYLPEIGNQSSPIYSTFVDDRAAQKWEECCQSAIECCHKMNKDPPLNAPPGELYCPRTWDGWACFEDTKAGDSVQLSCPDHVYFSSNPPGCQRHATKKCTENGTWFLNDQGGEWTDYWPCGITEDLLERIYVHCAAYAITILAVVPAIILFSVYKQLQVPRIKLHKNLFISLLANAICVLAFKSVMANHVKNSKESIITANTAACKVVLVLTRYFRSTNYMWMFCEGFYLHKLIAAAFAEQKTILPFYAIGWGFPVLVVIAYSIVRSTMFDSLCWALPADPYEWIINGPNMMSIVINFGFLANILRVLWSKLQARHANEPSQFRKAVKATLVLIPLFGVHFLLILYRPQSGGDCIWTKVHFYVYYLVDGLQGFVVALIYCYMNSEVQVLLKRSHRRLVERYEIKNNRGSKNRNFSYTTNYTTVAESIHPGTTIRRDKGNDQNDFKSGADTMEMTSMVKSAKDSSDNSIAN